MTARPLLLLTPPLVQTNAPYPATMHLTGLLRERGVDVHQRDLSIKVVRDVLSHYGGDEADELMELLSSSAVPPQAKLEASRLIEEIALDIRETVDESFGFSRYGERISASASDFGEIERLVRRRGVIDHPLERHLEKAIAETRPWAIGVACPFPGTLVGAFKIARMVRKRHPSIRLILGGGFVSTELRAANDPRIGKYFDELVFDEGYAPLLKLMKASRLDIPQFVRPSDAGIDWSEYFDVVETENPMHRLWSVGRWRKLQMARGCYWHKCAFCDVILPYVNCFCPPRADEIVEAMESGKSYHFVDEAMPPALVRQVCEELIRRKIECEWWGNIRFDAAFTPELCRLMADAGCIAVSGGLECADDRLLAMMRKGITLASAKKVLRAFSRAGIMVHAYLMYGFPTQTEAEAYRALDFVRGLFADGLLQSAFYHRFALTVHSPIARDAKSFGIEILPKREGKYRFCLNELPFMEPSAPDWDFIGEVLKTALYNFRDGRGLDKPASYWRRLICRRQRS